MEKDAQVRGHSTRHSTQQALYITINLDNEINTLSLEKHSVEVICEIYGASLKINNKVNLHALGFYRSSNVAIGITTLQVIEDALSCIQAFSSYIIIARRHQHWLPLTNKRDQVSLNELTTSIKWPSETYSTLLPTRIASNSSFSMKNIPQQYFRQNNPIFDSSKTKQLTLWNKQSHLS